MVPAEGRAQERGEKFEDRAHNRHLPDEVDVHAASPLGQRRAPQALEIADRLDRHLAGRELDRFDYEIELVGGDGRRLSALDSR